MISRKPGCLSFWQSGFDVKLGIGEKISKFRKHFTVLKRYKSESRRKGGCHDCRAIYRVSDRTAQISEYFPAILASMRDRELIAPYVPADLQSRVHYLSNNSRDIWGWSEMVYEYVKSL